MHMTCRGGVVARQSCISVKLYGDPAINDWTGHDIKWLHSALGDIELGHRAGSRAR